jgi:hypothetical protein
MPFGGWSDGRKIFRPYRWGLENFWTGTGPTGSDWVRLGLTVAHGT